METEYVTKTEFDLQVKEFENENVRQNHRITKVENDLSVIRDLTVSVEKLAVNLTYMKDSISKLSGDVESLKGVPSGRWDKLISGVIGAVAAAIGAGIIYALAHVA
jgi:hypothetical protein